MKKWEFDYLGNVCNLVRGPYGGSLKKDCFKESGYAVYEQQHAINNQFTNIRYFINESKYQEMKRFSVAPGDLIMSCSGTMGKVAIVPKSVHKGIINQALLKISPTDKIIARFLKYWMISPNFQEEITKLSKGVAIKNIASVKLLKKIKIPIPPVSEQKQIVEILDKAFEGIDRAIANTEKNLANACELFDNYLKTIFYSKDNSWIDRNLKEISTYFSRGKSIHRPRNDQKLYGGKYPFIQTGDIRHSNHLITDYYQTYNEEGLAQSKLWPKGTVCITIAANIAETGVLNFEACLPDSVIGIVVDKNKAYSMFVEYMLQAYQLTLKDQGKGTAQDNINLRTFKDKKFPFPDLQTQHTLVKNLDSLSVASQRLETIYQQKLQALQELKQSILHKAFTGELTNSTVEDVAA